MIFQHLQITYQNENVFRFTQIDLPFSMKVDHQFFCISMINSPSSAKKDHIKTYAYFNKKNIAYENIEKNSKNVLKKLSKIFP